MYLKKIIQLFAEFIIITHVSYEAHPHCRSRTRIVSGSVVSDFGKISKILKTTISDDTHNINNTLRYNASYIRSHKHIQSYIHGGTHVYPYRVPREDFPAYIATGQIFTSLEHPWMTAIYSLLCGLYSFSILYTLIAWLVYLKSNV